MTAAVAAAKKLIVALPRRERERLLPQLKQVTLAFEEVLNEPDSIIRYVKAGLIPYSRGRLTILDRKGLEAASCRCYRAVRAAFRWLQDEGVAT
jgi:hypothetical protein